MQIGELARRSGASERSLRHYEQRGLLTPARAGNGYRDYDEAAFDVVRTIRTLLDAGLTTRTIAQLLPCVELIGGQAVPCTDLLADLHHERRRIDDQIASLTTSQRILDTVIDAAARPSVLAPPG